MCAQLLFYSSSTVTKHKISGSDSGRLRPKIRLKIKKKNCLPFPQGWHWLEKYLILEVFFKRP